MLWHALSRGSGTCQCMCAAVPTARSAPRRGGRRGLVGVHATGFAALHGQAMARRAVALISLGFGGSTRIANPMAWFAAGFSVATALTLGCAFWTLRGGHWAASVVLGLAVSTIVSAAVFAKSAPSTSRSCQNSGEPPSQGTYDCDTAYGLGAPIMLVAFWVPAFAMSAAGSAAGRGLVRRRDR